MTRSNPFRVVARLFWTVTFVLACSPGTHSGTVAAQEQETSDEAKSSEAKSSEEKPAADKSADDQQQEQTRQEHTNRLATETSPYLLMHAHNPVDWYPWGEEALARARDENKPVFLSVGYSSCHWCHVMERESFLDEEIARFLNENFICIKVDREERPDIDSIYMTSLNLFNQLSKTGVVVAGRCRCL